jgi:hypothetical protein
LRRIIIFGTACAVLVCATAAYAAFDSWSGSSVSFTRGVGTKKAPVAVGHSEHWRATAPAGDRPAPLVDVKTTYYGVVADGKDFPKCTDAMIEANASNGKYDAACPKGSMVARGAVTSVLGPGTDPSTAKGTPCSPGLNVYNGGPGRLVFFLTATSPTQCGGLRTGATKPYDGTYKQVGNNLVSDIPEPPDISYMVAGVPNFYGSTITEDLTFLKVSKVVKGHRVAPLASFACKAGKRPWSVQFTTQDYNGGGREIQTVKGSDKC